MPRGDDGKGERHLSLPRLLIIAFVGVTGAVYDHGEALRAGEVKEIIVPGGESGPDSPRPDRGVPLFGPDRPGGGFGEDLDASRHFGGSFSEKTEDCEDLGPKVGMRVRRAERRAPPSPPRVGHVNGSSMTRSTVIRSWAAVVAGSSTVVAAAVAANKASAVMRRLVVTADALLPAFPG